VFARSLAHHVSKLKVVDGVYIGMKVKRGRYWKTETEHSWLVTPDGCIIEPYAVGMLSVTPILIPTKGLTMHAFANFYRDDPETALTISKKVATPESQKKLSIAIDELGSCIKNIESQYNTER
jgi:hypothetical protein